MGEGYGQGSPVKVLRIRNPPVIWSRGENCDGRRSEDGGPSKDEDCGKTAEHLVKGVSSESRLLVARFPPLYAL